jgi:aspartate-semialdehyde dehydrogenase
MPEKIPVAILAATGSVGQRFVQLLDDHPWFEVVALTGSAGRVGQTYGESCHWILTDPMPGWAARMTIKPSEPQALGVGLVFSALPKQYAYEIEPAFARAGCIVCTNAGAFRPEDDVPILLPEINPQHLDLIQAQREKRGWSGAIICNPNCTSTGMTVALKALDDAFSVDKVLAVSMQAVSGAGYPGVSSLDVIDNVIPYIGGEEEKVEWEPRKILGSVDPSGINLAPMRLSVHANRVAVSDGHLVCMSIETRRSISPQAAEDALRAYLPPQVSRDLPSTPRPAIAVKSQPDRPQPRLDRMTGRGMSTVVGRVRPDPLLDIKLVVLSHNTIRGAAGGSVYNAELLVQEGFLN